MFSFFAIKNLLTAYHIDKSSTEKIIEPKKERVASPLFFYYFIFNNSGLRANSIYSCPFLTAIPSDSRKVRN